MKKLRFITLLLLSVLVLFSGFILAQSNRRDARVQPEKVMDVIGVKPGMVIGEAGAGRGYLTFNLSRRVGETGMIYANDINRGVLRSINNRCKRENINNIKTVLGKVEDPLFPVNELDMVVMLRAFHDFEKKVEWLKNAKKYMKPDATLVIIDGHDYHTQLNKEKVEKMGEEAGYQLVQYETFLTEDFIYVFRVKISDL
ncbi:MAG: class I SAM-dependent methyltransferase [Candidatus Aminicenantes bacterium]|nr:class I SAM-dependent methyltransferase [Candidatus Aminicenantes bacterium]